MQGQLPEDWTLPQKWRFRCPVGHAHIHLNDSHDAAYCTPCDRSYDVEQLRDLMNETQDAPHCLNVDCNTDVTEDQAKSIRARELQEPSVFWIEIFGIDLPLEVSLPSVSNTVISALFTLYESTFRENRQATVNLVATLIDVLRDHRWGQNHSRGRKSPENPVINWLLHPLSGSTHARAVQVTHIISSELSGKKHEYMRLTTLIHEKIYLTHTHMGSVTGATRGPVATRLGSEKCGPGAPTPVRVGSRDRSTAPC